MAVDESITRAKSMSASTRRSTMSEQQKTNENSTVPARLGHLLARKHRIERWAYKERSSSITDAAATASATLGTVSAQKRSESTHSQAGRILNIHLLQLSEQRQKTIEQNNFDQKLFANKQALKHKDNQSVLRTLSYVRKCCKYANANDDEQDSINPAIFLENSTTKRSRSRSPTATPPTVKRNLSANPRTQTSASMAETFLRHNRKHLGSSPINRKLTGSYTPTMTNPSVTPVDDDSQKRHVQFQIHTDGKHLTSQSAHVISKSNSYSIDKQIIRNVASANGVRTLNSSPDTRITNSAPLVRSTTSVVSEPSNARMEEVSKPKRSLSRISSAKNSIQEFRRHPERFLSASNRYLPLLRRQALETGSSEPSGKHQKDKTESIKRQRMNFSPPISRLSDGSDLMYDDAKSFLSEENEISTPVQTPAWLEEGRKAIRKRHPSKKINMMDTGVDDETAEHRLALARLRDREFARLQELIRTSPIEQILEPFSAIKTDEVAVINQRRLSATSETPQPSRILQLNDILQSIDSLCCSDAVDRRVRRQIDIEKNRAKLGILIF